MVNSKELIGDIVITFLGLLQCTTNAFFIYIRKMELEKNG